MEAKRISAATYAERPITDRPIHAWPLTIERKPDEIPITAPVNLEAFLAGDNDTCQVVAKVPEGWSYNGWFFTRQALMDMAQTIASNGITGGLGHVETDNDFPEVAVLWVGAVFDAEAGAVFARGYVNPERPDLKRLIRAGVINRVSEDGYGAFGDVNQPEAITSFNVVSLDLVPRLRNGMESGIEARDMKQNGKGVKDGMNEDKDKQKETAETGATGQETGADGTAGAGMGMDLEKELAALKDLLRELGENPAQRLADLLALEARVKEAEAKEVLEGAIADMVEGDDARALVRMVLKPVQGEVADAAQGRVKACLETSEMKRILAKRFADTTFKGEAPKADNGPKFEY